MTEDETSRFEKLRRLRINRKRLSRSMKKAEGVSTRHARRFVLKRVDNIRKVSREITLWLLLVGAMIAGIGFQVYGSQSGYIATAPASGGTYAEGVVGQINSLNPLYSASDAEESIRQLVFSSLYKYDTTGHLLPDLATGMKISNKNRTYTVSLRTDASWQDKTPVTAQDVVFTINLIKDPATLSPLRVNWTNISVRAVDSRTVEFTLPAVYAAFPEALTFSILPEHLLSSIAPGIMRESTYSQAPIGSGPFSFDFLQAASGSDNAQTVHLIANKNYYGGAPLLDRFEIHSYFDQNSLAAAVKNNEVNGAAGLPPSLLLSAKQTTYRKVPQPIDTGVYLLLNNTNPILRDVKVRKALQLATDTTAIRNQLGDSALPLGLPFLDGQLTGDVPKADAYNQKKAADLLDQAGWKLVNGTRVNGKQTLKITITTTKDARYESTMNAVLKQWSGLGIDVQSNEVDASSVSSRFVQDVLQSRNFDVLLYELAIGADPDVFAYWHSSQIGISGFNFTSYSNARSDDNLSSARMRLEPALRNLKYIQFARQWLADVPAIGLYQPVEEYVVSNDATSVLPGSKLVTLADRYANILDWSVANRSVYKTP